MPLVVGAVVWLSRAVQISAEIRARQHAVYDLLSRAFGRRGGFIARAASALRDARAATNDPEVRDTLDRAIAELVEAVEAHDEVARAVN